MGAYADEVQATSPLAWWRLGEGSGTTAADETTNHDGDYLDAVTLGQTSLVPAESDTSADFNGTTGRVSVPASSGSALDITGDLTAAAWVDTDTVASGNGSIIGLQDGTSSSGPYVFRRRNDFLEIIWYDSGGTQALHNTSGTFSFTTGTTFFVAAVRDATAETVTLYVDGEEVFSGAYTIIPDSIDATVSLGIASSEGDDPIRTFNGHIDEAAIWNRALSATEISDLYAAGVEVQAKLSDDGSTLTVFGATVDGCNENGRTYHYIGF